MATITATVDVDLDEFSTKELIRELERRRADSFYREDWPQIEVSLADDDLIAEAVWRFQRGEIEDGFIILSRATGADLSDALRSAH